MTSEELYRDFKVLLNKNGRFTNVEYVKSNFVVLFNREQERWYSQTINKKKDSDDIDDIERLLIPLELEYIDKSEQFVSYKLPDDLFQRVLLQVYATKGCTKMLNAQRVNKLKNLNELLTDEFSSPSFEWEETLYTLGNGNVNVYFSDFDVTKVILHYYKKLTKIDLAGYITLDNKPSINIDSTLDDIFLQQILDRVVVEVQAEVENQVGYQVSGQRVATQERVQF